MSFYYTPYILLPFFSSLINGCLAHYAWRRRHMPAAYWLFGLMAGLSLWSLSFTLNIASVLLWQKQFFYVSGTIFVCITLVCTLPMVMEIAGIRGAPHRLVPLLAVVPLISVILAVSAPWHHLFFNATHLIQHDKLVLLGLQEGLYLKFVHYPYAYLYYLGIVIICLIAMTRRNQPRRSSLFLIITATLVPVFIDIFNLSPVKELRLTTASLSVSGICYWLAVFRHHLLDLVPVARATLFEQMQEPVMVTDPQGRLAEYN